MQGNWRHKDYSNLPEFYTIPPPKPPGHGWMIGYIASSLVNFLFIIPGFLQFLILAIKGLSKKATLIMLGILHGLMNLSIPLLDLAEKPSVFVFIALFMGMAWTGLQLFLANKAIDARIKRMYTQRTRRRLSNELLDPMLRYKLFGTPGQVGNAIAEFGEARAQAGAKGEIWTAEMLEPLLRIPGTRIFHGMQWLGSDNADVDHIVVNGSKIALIDTKLWSGNNHTFQPNGNILSQGNKTVVRDQLKFPEAVNGYIEMYSHSNHVAGWVGVHAPNRQPVTTDNRFNPAPSIPLADMNVVVESIGQWFDQNLTGEVRAETITSLVSNLK